jgi:hypothetical protein
MANPVTTRPKYTAEQREAWSKAHFVLNELKDHVDCLDPISKRALHIAMSQMRAEQGRKHRGPIETPPKHPGKLVEFNAVRLGYRLEERVEEWKQYLREPGLRKLFIIVDPELPPVHKAVQASHCAAQFQKEHPFAPWINGTVVLAEPTEKTYNLYKGGRKNFKTGETIPQFEYFTKSQCGGQFRTHWREPDLGNSLTAIAVTTEFQNSSLSRNLVLVK